MKRISNNRDLFEAAPGEVITVRVEASKTPYQATFADLESGGQWTQVQEPTPQEPVEERKFTMPPGAREFFQIVYSFPPAGQMDSDAKYQVSFSGKDGTGDGPNDVFPPVAGDLVQLSYELRRG
jgi:hypothetical protein